ncbi:putative SAM-dependent methyltransferase [Methanocella arvoryzae MRE50]|uniref:SAM-dependent methyltransferase n=1 Tax=Methanocella arvoryzae (strain DSM 22066 / NBRC 105507 / MRE50) TaxID=351160 RepID=Q0W088_METAR|nr:putative SAM-dependent methyltransferase [Methanocella arvoryzae MRE50]
MTVRHSCVIVPKQEGEKIRRALMEAELLDGGYKIRSDAQYLYIPVVPDVSGSILGTVAPGLSISECEFEESEKRKTVEDLIGFAPSYEIIGDIAVTAQSYDRSVGEAIMAVHKNVKTVLEPTTGVTGEFRVREFKVLSGEERTTTTYKEHGFIYEMDLAKVYFSPRLSTERKRIIDQISDLELVVDMFAGIGPFAIPAAKKAMYVVAVDKNPYAVEYMKRNIQINHVTNIEAVCADVREIKLPQQADRAIMNLPHSAHEFLDKAFELVRTGGIIHYYDIRPESEIFDAVISMVREKASKSGCLIEIVNKRIVRSYSPHEYNIVLDIRITGKQESFEG